MSETASGPAANTVQVRTGSQDLPVPAGLTVAQIRQYLNNIGQKVDGNHTARVGSSNLSESDIPEGGSVLTFIKPMGQKG